MADKAVPVSAYLPPELFDTFRRLADQQERSVSWLVGFAIKQYIASQADAGRVLAPGGMPVSPYQSNIRTAVHPGRVVPGQARQVDLEDAIVAAVRRGPSKAAKHK
jgi:predicted transcriptional regulator